MTRSLMLFVLGAVAACGNTGSALVSFTGVAGGAPDIAAGTPFVTGSGYTVTLDSAHMHLGAIYLNQNNPLSGAGETGCVLSGVYVAQLFGPLDLDLLSPTAIPFPTVGEGTETRALTAEVWLLEGDINAPDSDTHVLDLAGTATKDSTSWPFSATVTIGSNRAKPAPSVSMPGANPICKQRIVTPIAPADGSITPTEGGQLTLQIDVRHMFDPVDFSLFPPSATLPPTYVFPDALGGISDQLFSGLRASASVYSVGYTQGVSP